MMLSNRFHNATQNLDLFLTCSYIEIRLGGVALFYGED